MEQKHKFYAGLLFCIFIATLFVGYSVGYHEAEKLYGDGWQGCNDALADCNNGYGRCTELLGECITTVEVCIDQLKKEEVNYKLELLEKGYDNGWWSYNWSKEDFEESWSCDESVSWICYSENCTDEQINKFIEQNYTYYGDFSDCYIWRN